MSQQAPLGTQHWLLKTDYRRLTYRLMIKAKQGDMIRIRCSGRMIDGREFDLARDNETVDLIIGHGDFLPALEQAIVGMSPGKRCDMSACYV